MFCVLQLKKRKRGDEPDIGQAQEVDVPEQQPAAPEDDPEFGTFSLVVVYGSC